MPKAIVVCPTLGKEGEIEMDSKPAGDICPFCERYKDRCHFTITFLADCKTPAELPENAFGYFGA